MQNIKLLALGVLVVAGLSGCLRNDLERAAVGAAVGGVGAAAVGGSVATGVVVGGLAGAICDEVTHLCR